MSELSVRECVQLAEVGPPAAWDALRARAPASVNGSRRWLTAVFATTHRATQPVLLAAEAGGRLVGLLPLALHDRKEFPTLRFAGAPHNDLNDLLALPGYEQDAARAVVHTLERLHERGWTLSLDDVDPGGHLASVADTRVLEWARGGAAPVIDLRGPWLDAASGRRRRQWGRRLRRLQDRHVVRFRRVEGAAMAARMEGFAALREARRRATGREPDQPPARLVDAAVRELAPAGKCALMEMLVDGESAASDLYLLDQDVALMWLRGLDPAFQAYPCGHLLLRATSDVATSPTSWCSGRSRGRSCAPGCGGRR
jgi:CelD/BcsL family acetyltransferase involved in cellulose biosynthesis